LLLRKQSDTATAESQSFGQILTTNLPVLLQSAGMTVFLSVVSFPLAILIGIGVAVGRLYGPWYVAKPLGGYVELLRGTPLMLQLYAIFFLLPKIGLKVPALVAAISGLAINYSAYEAEIYRAGLQAIPRGQMEAALALGMTRSLAIRRILLPQAFRIVIPPVTNDFIALSQCGIDWNQVIVMEVDAIRPQFRQAFDDSSWRDGIARRLAERIPAWIANRPKTKGKFVLFLGLKTTHELLLRDVP
jgi:His/Glu/Gln/Arg/opine family amino acid ABC transporter permease subunit